MKRLGNIITPFYPPYLKGDKERISMLRAKNAPLKIRGARGVMKERPLILRRNLQRN